MPVKCPWVEKNNAQIKEVVIIGNGPSGISLSYMLSGNTPYYKGRSSDEYLHSRLQHEPDVPLYFRDLEFLSEGLQGRSSNPISLLFDALAHPDADLGIHRDSLIEWKCHSELSIDHIVLGRGNPGGSWSSMEGEFLTLSLESWMELPNLKLKKDRNEEEEGSRVSVSTVTDYYRSYVKKMKLQKNFVVGAEVLSVKKIMDDDSMHSLSDDEYDSDVSECLSYISNSSRCCNYDEYSARDEEIEKVMMTVRDSWDPICNPILFGTPCCYDSPLPSSLFNFHQGIKKTKKGKNALWKVTGVRKEGNNTVPFAYITRNVVLAAGSYDSPNKLNIIGENALSSKIVRSLKEMESSLEEIKESNFPLCIVGCGLSAGDAILAAIEHRIRVIHVFRRNPMDNELVYAKLPKAIYPEYHHLHKMMKSQIKSEYYYPSPQSEVREISINSAKSIKISLDDGRNFCASFLVSFIGSSPDLNFFEAHDELGIIPGRLISKENPIYIDSFTHECISNSGVYAMGPLVGDNFVRFLQGGALAIASDLIKRLDKKALH